MTEEEKILAVFEKVSNLTGEMSNKIKSDYPYEKISNDQRKHIYQLIDALVNFSKLLKEVASGKNILMAFVKATIYQAKFEAVIMNMPKEEPFTTIKKEMKDYIGQVKQILNTV